MTELQKKLNERAKLAADQKAAFDAFPDVSQIPADKLSEIETRNDDLKSLDAEIERLTRLEEMKSGAQAAYKHDGQQPGEVRVIGSEYAGETVVERNKSGDLSIAYEEGWQGMDQKTRAIINATPYKRAFRNYIRSKLGIHGLGPGDIKTLQEGADSQGGFLVPEDMLQRLIDRQPTPTRVAGLVTRLQTSRDALTIPKVNYTDTTNNANNIYTTGIRVTKTGEVPSSSTAHRVTDPAFGQVRIPVHTMMLSMPLTNDMIEDSAFPLVEWASGKFRETKDLLYDNEIINGSGIGGPLGILDASNLGTGANQVATVVTGSAAALTADGVIDLHYSVPPQYRSELRYLLNYLNAAKALAKLKDGQNQYLFKMGGTYSAPGGLQGEFPDTLNGAPLVYSEFMPSPAANAYPIIFGAFSGYYLVERIGFSVQVLSELYAETNQQLLLGRLRFGGQTAEPWKLKVQKCST